VTLNGDETYKNTWRERVIKRNCESTDDCCSKCINVLPLVSQRVFNLWETNEHTGLCNPEINE